MNTQEALEGSIAKWEAIVAGTGVDYGDMNCPLCVMADERGDGCNCCPVCQKTGSEGCAGSPYWSFVEHGNETHYDGSLSLLRERRTECPTCTKLAQKELDFLKSLREDV